LRTVAISNLYCSHALENLYASANIMMILGPEVIKLLE